MYKVNSNKSKSSSKQRYGADSSSSIEESLEVYRSILQHVQDFVSFVDLEYRYLAVSKGYVDLFEMPESQIVGLHVWDLHGLDRFEKSLKPRLDKTLKDGTVGQFHAEVVSPRGEKRIVQSTFVPYRESTGRISGVVVNARDVSCTYKAEQAVKKEMELSQLIIDSTPDFVFFKDTDGVYQRCNTAFQQFVSLPEKDIIGKKDSDLMSVESANHIREKDLQVFTTNKVCQNEEWVTYNNSRRRLLSMTKVPVTDENQQLTGLLGIGRDITQEREGERNRMQAALLFQVTSDPCLILTPDAIISDANPATYRTFGYEANSMIGLPADYLLHHSPEEIPLRTVLSLRTWKGEMIGVHRTGESRPYLLTLNTVPTMDNESVGFPEDPDTLAGKEIDRHIITLLDLGEIGSYGKALSLKAYHDPLTGLPNRLLLTSRLEHALAQAKRNDDYVAVLFIDIDGFKPINDRFGHDAGDQVLVEVCQRLKQPLRKSDTLARLGGDEFIIVLEHLERIDVVDRVSQKLLRAVREGVFKAGGGVVDITISMGISIFPLHAVTASELIKKADLAMYLAKDRGANQACFFHNKLASS
ncbi:bifunctional diguanylate cyclase/phosphodiesterase [Motiliproteus sp. MSK22-1]|uniref:sensor domain-containing protein n=1 Tax=Motiliproteus sp. MSK22-1 TaxID=1897630 RepID=UPI0009762E7C|nr:diguanylate cyclase [Motiliproteus sp. MSK22-1]OMH32829.1 hypothetical protein BGP75_15015 [Motiliproteus sp. MSK22-1]